MRTDLSQTAWRMACVVFASVAGAGFAHAQQTLSAVVNGQVTMSRQGSTLNIANSPGSIIQWQQFSIAANERVNFNQISAQSSVLNRVVGADPSAILGTLWSNGRVFLINPNGILFGAGAQIDVAGLVASTLNLSNADFAAGRLRFVDNPGAGSVVNQGRITTPTGGTVYLIAPDVQNAGVITSPQGEVILAAGRSVEIVASDTLNLRVQITAPDNQALNVGQILANSGRIGVYAGLIRNTGTLRADGIVVGQGGEIYLRATKSLDIQGTLSAGTIQIDAPDVRTGTSAVIPLSPPAPIVISGTTLGTITLNTGNVTLTGGHNIAPVVAGGFLRSFVGKAVQSAQLIVANGGPLAPTVLSGLATFGQTGSTLTITSNTAAIVNWQNFSINSIETTRFIQQSGSGAVLNRVVGADPSAILGDLQSNK